MSHAHTFCKLHDHDAICWCLETILHADDEWVSQRSHCSSLEVDSLRNIEKVLQQVLLANYFHGVFFFGGFLLAFDDGAEASHSQYLVVREVIRVDPVVLIMEVCILSMRLEHSKTLDESYKYTHRRSSY
jgi:hypothetical protein